MCLVVRRRRRRRWWRQIRSFAFNFSFSLSLSFLLSHFLVFHTQVASWNRDFDGNGPSSWLFVFSTIFMHVRYVGSIFTIFLFVNELFFSLPVRSSQDIFGHNTKLQTDAYAVTQFKFDKLNVFHTKSTRKKTRIVLKTNDCQNKAAPEI